MTVWCKGFLKAHAALWKPAVRWALSAGGVKAGFVGRHWLLFTEDNYRELGGSGRSEAPPSSEALALGTSLFAKLQVRPLNHSEREVGMAVVSGRMRARVPPRSCVAPRNTSYGPARRGAALLCWGLSRRGAMRLCGERLGSVGMGVGRAGGWVS